MSTNRLYTLFTFAMVMALVSAGVLAIPVLIGGLNQPPTAAELEAARLAQRRGEWYAGQPAVSIDPEIARFVVHANGLDEQARLAQRRGEWNAGSAAVTTDPEITRFVAYSNGLAEQARLAQRDGEWLAGEQNLNEKLDLHDRHPNVAASDPETARFVAYAYGLAERARLAQRQGEWYAGANSPVALDIEAARSLWRANSYQR